MPWLLWCYDRQTWGHRELVIIDSSRTPYVSTREDVRVIHMPHRSTVGAKRNRALAEARGEYVFWFDDDDWQHPERIARVAAQLITQAAAGPVAAHFVDLDSRTARIYRGARGQVIFNGAGFHRTAVLAQQFPEHVRKASDAHWLRAVHAALPGRIQAMPDEDLFVWLCHAHNLSNPATSKRFDRSLAQVAAQVGADAWADTDAQLKRLAAPTTPRKARSQARNQSRKATSQERATEPSTQADSTSVATPVSAVIKATVLDAGYLDVMVRHMLAQARYAFAEKLVVVDHPPEFTGKYRTRDRAAEAELTQVLERLRDDGVIDRWVDVDYAAGHRRRVMETYFGPAGSTVGTHASTGGPIYATLFGLAQARHDLVLQMDADVFFHSSDQSWITAALKVLQAHDDVWLMMTHPGPPAGPAGASLKPPNLNRARWDAGLCIWRFSTATTRYFLCDRRDLRGRLRPQWVNGACEPLERCISRALAAHGACRGALGDLQSWHLHAWSHAAPFPELAPRLAETIARGEFPAAQAGDYDLRLDRAPMRECWRALMQQTAEPRQPRTPLPEERAAKPVTRNKTRLHHARPTHTPASVSVVIPIRDRPAEMLHNTLATLAWQDAGPPAEVVVVSQGSQPACNDALALLCAETGARLVQMGAPTQPWNKPLALNTGIRATRTSSSHILVMDGDILLAPNFIREATRSSDCLVLCRCLDLAPDATAPQTPAAFDATYAALKTGARLRPETSSGGVQLASRQFFFKVQGYDEDLEWWGAMDNDMVHRARAAGLDVTWISDVTAILHQWHPRKTAALRTQSDINAARRAWQRNHQLVQTRRSHVVRNGPGWGGGISLA